MQSYRGKYNPNDERAYQISRSKVDYFLECPRCFYMDRRLGIGRPSTPPFTLNSAVDKLLKAEFDVRRANDEQHPLQEAYGIDCKPAPHELLDKWRENFHGVQYHHPKTNFLVFGAIDDLWINGAGEYVVVDYKATAKADPVEILEDKPWHDQYRRQMEFYQWLLRRNGHKVSDTGYFVYCTGDTEAEAFDGKLDFRIRLIPYTGKDSWVEPTIVKAWQCLQSDTIPQSSKGCEYCAYRQQYAEAEALDAA